MRKNFENAIIMTIFAEWVNYEKTQLIFKALLDRSVDMVAVYLKIGW